MRRQLLVQKLLADRNKTVASDAATKKLYEQMVKKTAGKEEIRARHILVKTEDEAKAIRKQLKDGADFAKLAKEKSLDKGSATNGGDVGYFAEGQMVPEFTKAAYGLKDKGDISDPVKTSFGYHVIQLTDRRPLPIPTYAEAKPDLEKKLAADANQAYINQLLKDAKVEYFAPDGSKKPLPADEKKINVPADAKK